MVARLNVGCGPIQPPGWINIDNSNRARLAKYFPWIDKTLVWLKILVATEYNRHTQIIDIRKRLPFGDKTVSAIYGGEVLEHLTYPEGQLF